MTRKLRKRVKNSPNPQARRPRATYGKGVATRDATSESEEDEAERVEWGTRQYGVRMSPAHPWYVGRGDDACGGEVVYSIQEIRKLLSSQPEDMKRWLTTSQMGWALTREENEVVNQKDERESKQVARQLAPMISTFIRAQWESGDLENVEDEKRRILEEAMELHHGYRRRRLMEWESPSASLIEQDPEVVPDVDIAAQVGRDFSLMKRSRDMNQARDM